MNEHTISSTVSPFQIPKVINISGQVTKLESISELFLRQCVHCILAFNRRAITELDSVDSQAIYLNYIDTGQ